MIKKGRHRLYNRDLKFYDKFNIKRNMVYSELNVYKLLVEFC